MYRVIIADDEPWAIYGLQKLIDWENLGFSIVATANDGLSALEAVRQHKPDLLISDIRMPGLDGLTLVRAAKDCSPKTAVILVTGYSDFAYVQEALRQGVFDYLVKQVKKTELINALIRVREHFQSTASTDWNLYFSLFDEESSISVHDCAAQLGLPSSAHCCLMTALQPSTQSNTMIGRLTSSDRFSRISFRTGAKKETVLLCFDNVPSFDDLLSASQLPALNVGASQVASTDADFYELYRQSEIAMMTSIVQGHGLISYQKTEIDICRNEIHFFDQAVRASDKQSALNWVMQVKVKAHQLSFDAAVSAANALVAHLQAQCFGAYEELEQYQAMQISPSAPLASLFAPIERCILAEGSNRPMVPSQIQKIMDALDELYTQDVRITDLAKRFFVSSNYLSILIKRETNCTFTELLIQKRIALAKKLLTETDLPIQDIVDRVGYKEYSCFIKLFKKYTGMTPFVYRKEQQRTKDCHMTV